MTYKNIKMEKLIFFSLIVTVVYSLFKILEMKYIEKEWMPVKILIRDVVMVFAASFVGSNVINYSGNNITQFFNVLTDTKVNPTSNAQVFTDNPNF